MNSLRRVLRSPDRRVGTPSIAPEVQGAPLLCIENLSLTIGDAAPLESVSLSIAPGERVGLVGESGSGKSLTALAAIGLHGFVGAELGPASRIRYQGQDLIGLPDENLALLRGSDIAMVFQDPITSLNPVHSVSRQITEVLKLHRPDLRSADHKDEVQALLKQVQIRRIDQVAQAFPHELSGGMRQRVMIAMALAGHPRLIIADEPTTALDVTVQAEILDLLYEISVNNGISILLITHDLSVVAGFTDRVIVMYGGRVVEHGDTTGLFDAPQHPYTSALLGAIPRLEAPVERLVSIPGSPPSPAERFDGCSFLPRCSHGIASVCSQSRPPLLEVGPTDVVGAERLSACFRSDQLSLAGAHGQDVERRVRVPKHREKVLLETHSVSKSYRVRSESSFKRVPFAALEATSIRVMEGEILGIVGESGSGKTTLARCLLHLIEPSEGHVEFEGRRLSTLSGSSLRRLRAQMQMIFQDPASSLDPRQRVRSILSEPLKIHGVWKQPGHDEAWLRELVDLVHLPARSLDRYPHEFSGGQRQRIAIARALALRPKLLVCDEPVSALDVSVRASVLNLFRDLNDELGLTLIFVAHDLALVRQLCDRVIVMAGGSVIESAETEALFAAPQHPHTVALINAQPSPDPAVEHRRRLARGQVRARTAST